MTDTSWTKRHADEVEAMVELMYLVAQADGEFAVVERRLFLKSVQSLSEGHLESTDLLRLIDEAEGRLGSLGLDRLLEQLGQRLPDELARRLAFGLCTQVALADDSCGDAERRMLDSIAAALGIPPEDDAEITESVRMAKRGSVAP